MRRREFLQTLAAGTALVTTGGLATPAIAKDLKGTGELIVTDGGGAWGEAKRKAYFDPFEAETGIKIIPESRSEDGSVRASIQAGAPRYDVGIITGGSTPSFARDNMLLPIDYSYFEKSDLDGFKTITPSKYSLPHIIYSLLVAYDSEAFKNKAPTNWADFWNVEKFPGGRALGPGAWGPDSGTFEAALMADGVAPADLYPIDFDRAFKSLDRIKPHIVKYWESGAEGPQLLIDKQVAATSAWNGRVTAAREQGAKIDMTWNQGIIQYDNWVVLKGAANTENAWKFLAFVSRAENQAEFVKNILYAPPNSGAFEFIDAERAKLLPTSSDVVKQQVVQNYDFWNSLREDGQANNQFAIAQWEKWIAG